MVDERSGTSMRITNVNKKCTGMRRLASLQRFLCKEENIVMYYVHHCELKKMIVSATCT